MLPEFASALAERILQPQALLVGQHLVRGGLADVDAGESVQVARAATASLATRTSALPAAASRSRSSRSTANR